MCHSGGRTLQRPRVCETRRGRPETAGLAGGRSMSSDASEIEEHLRAASDASLLLLTESSQLERHKRRISPGEPRFEEIARSVRLVAQALAQFTEFEEEWARRATDGRTDIETID